MSVGRQYSRQGNGTLYIFVTDDDELIDVKHFPEVLNLFGCDSSWCISPRIAICHEVDEKNIDVIEFILRMYDFRKCEYDERNLENYYLSGGNTPLTGLE